MSELDKKNISSKEKNTAEEPAKKKAFFQFLSRSKKDLQSNKHQAKVEIIKNGEKLPSKSKSSMRERFTRALSKTGRSFNDLFLAEQEINDELLEGLEERLLLADVGIETTEEIINELSNQLKNIKLVDREMLVTTLENILIKKLVSSQKPLEIYTDKNPFVILVVGVNGVGKTTTIGKIAKHFSLKNNSIMLAAGDTFRAAAVEQLQSWGKINNIPVVSQGEGSDSASVIFDAIESARSNNIDLLIADTAGRLHTKNHLMEELKKVKRVIGKLDNSAPHEVLLVIDAGTGQNAINQMQEFNNAVSVTGLVLTKLDGTAKGGIIFSLVQRFGVPIRFVGLGENVNDLQPFDAECYVQALLNSRKRKH